MENLDDELMDLFERERMGILKAPEQAKLETRLKDPRTKATWDDLHRIARAWATKGPRTLPDDFAQRVKAEIEKREGTAPAGKAEAPARVSRWRPRMEQAAGLALAAGLAGLALGRWVFPAGEPRMGAGQGVAYLCELTGATVEGKLRAAGDLFHHLPQTIHARGPTVPPEIRVLAPEAQLCLGRINEPCTGGQPAPSAVLIYTCRAE